MSRGQREIMAELAASGLSPDQHALVVELVSAIASWVTKTRSSGAIRTERWRHKASQRDAQETPTEPVTTASQASQSVTCDNALLLTSLEVDNKPEEKKVRGRSKKRASPISPAWSIPDRARDLAVELSVNVEDAADRFRDYLRSSGKLYADYDAGFCNFVRNTPKFNGNRGPPGGGKRGFLDLALDLERQNHERNRQDLEELPFPGADH